MDTILDKSKFPNSKQPVEMNKFSCGLPCTWMTIIDCLFYVSDSLT